MNGQELGSASEGLDDAFQESLNELGEPEEVVPETETEVEPESPDEDEPRFTDTDPEDLPEQLQKTHKQLQADYTRKTQALAAARKEFEAEKAAYDKWKPAIELYNTDVEIQKRVDAAFAKVEAAAEKAGVTDPDDFDAFISKYDKQSQETLKQLATYLTKKAGGSLSPEVERQKAELAKVQAELEQTRTAMNERVADAQQKRFEKAHPTWKEDTTPRQKKLFMMELYERPEADPIEIYEDLMAEFDKSATTKAAGKVRELVSRTDNRPVRTPARTARAVEKIDSLHDAFESSRRELGIG